MNLVFDIEANGLDPDKLFCLVAYNVDTQETYKFGLSSLDRGLKLLANADKLIGHNILGYDIPAIKKVAGIDLYDKKIVDTLVLSRLFKPTREGGHGLESWGYRLDYIKGDYGKQEDAWDFYSPEMLDYCERDVLLNYKVYEFLKTESKGFSSKSVVLEHNVAKIINQQRSNGFLLDEKHATILVSNLQGKINETQDKVRETFKPRVTTLKLSPKYTKAGKIAKTASDEEGNGVRLNDEEYIAFLNGKEVTRSKIDQFNLGSRKQIGEYLIDFGWNPKKFTPTGQPIVDESTLSKVKNIPEAALICEFLTLQKRIAQVSSWIDEMEGDSRVRGYVNSNGAVTSRMTHSRPNMAQIVSSYSPYGKECRACWTVPEGYKLVGIDASQLELRMLAHYMDNEDYINEILNGDIHTANQNLAGLESRSQAKTFIYALLYGAGDAKLGKVVGRGREAGKRLRESFFSSLPSFEALKNRVSREASKGYLKALDGRKLFVRSEHAALNTLLQGAGALVMKQALIILDKYINDKGLDAKFVANVHDEWQLEVREDQAELVGELGVRSIKETTCSLELKCPLDGEYNVGRNWAETH